jgi:hypothetical protein
MKKTNKAEYYGGRIKGLVELTASIIAKDPSLATDLDRLHATIKASGLEGYGVRETCFNCSRSMKINKYTAGIGHALLLDAMAKAVREETRKGIPFTEANRVHIDRLQISTSIKKQQSQAGYLGLIHQVAEGKRSGYWLITQWGWKALRGEQIPEWVKYWNGHLIERSEALTTFPRMMETHKEKIEQQLTLGKMVKTSDHRAAMMEYDPVQWAEYEGTIDQKHLFNTEDDSK